MQYRVMRQKGTEPAGSGRYTHGHSTGVFACAGCGAELFSAAHQFESGTGWPSFDRPIDPRRLETAPDFSNPAEARVEVDCARCGAHLGHVFRDGPPPTGLRFCLNSVALQLKSAPGAPRKTAPAGRSPTPEPTPEPPTGSR